MTRRATILLMIGLVALPALTALGQQSAVNPADEDVLLRAMKKELARSFDILKKAEKDPLYFLSYETHDAHRYHLGALLGAIRTESENRRRALTADVRIGTYALDNTHQIKGPSGRGDLPSVKSGDICEENDEAALRADIWLLTDDAYKHARERFTKVKTNKSVTAEEEDKSDDFSVEKPCKSYDRAAPPDLDKAAWKDRLRRLSEAFKKYAFIIGSAVNLTIETENRYIVNTEGTEVVAGQRYIRLSYSINGRSKDGMDLQRFKTYPGNRMEDLPKDDEILRDMERSASELQALIEAPIVEPYSGPAIFKARAAGVYFHEIMGHRMEGHRQKLQEEGQTFTKKIGKPVTAAILTICDDATLPRWSDGRFLGGFYTYDDEGIPARRVSLIENGILKGFLMSRSPIQGFANSNGHGRRSSGQPIVARMGSLLVTSSKTVPYPQLREMLIQEIQTQKKPYGLIFEDISGGFTITQRGHGQAFQVNPLLVYRVYPDGRADETVRGVNIVGTPLTSFTKIIATGDDYDIFNGTCGAESGWVNVSAVSPSVLFSEIEVEKRQTASEKPPILPPPHHDKEGKR